MLYVLKAIVEEEEERRKRKEGEKKRGKRRDYHSSRAKARSQNVFSAMVRVRYKQSFRGVTLSCAILEDVFVGKDKSYWGVTLRMCSRGGGEEEKEKKEGEKRGRKEELSQLTS